MEDIRVLKRARYYISAMSDGINPLTGEYAGSDDTISQERIQKCCAYVAELLDKLIENGGLGHAKKMPFSITPQQVRQIHISQQPIGINDVAKRINAVTAKNMRGISGAKIASWLAENGWLTLEQVVSTETKEVVKTRKVINDRSHELGITSVQSINTSTGEAYEKLLYGETAQKFILSNIDKIIAQR